METKQLNPPYHTNYDIQKATVYLQKGHQHIGSYLDEMYVLVTLFSTHLNTTYSTPQRSVQLYNRR